MQTSLHKEVYRVIQEVAVSVNLRKKLYKNICLILNGYRDRAV